MGLECAARITLNGLLGPRMCGEFYCAVWVLLLRLGNVLRELRGGKRYRGLLLMSEEMSTERSTIVIHCPD